MFGLIGKFGRWLGTKFLTPIKNFVHKINKKFDGFFLFSWELSSLFAKTTFVIQGIFTIISGSISILFAILNFKSLVDIVTGTVRGQEFWLEKLEHVVQGYPSFQSLISTMDSSLSSLGTFFNPALTFTGIIQMFGIGDAFNTIVVCAVQGIAFVISMRLLFWSLGRVKLSMVKPIK